MDRDSRVRKIIEQMVRQEIEKLLAETKDIVQQAVRNSLLPQLRTAIRDSISEVMEEIIAEEISPAQEAGISEEISGVIPVSPGEEIEEMPAEEEPKVVEVSNEAGRYVYCVADSGVAVSLGNIGIEGNEVYTIPYEGLCAVVHNCPTEPYKSEDEEVVKGWVQAHQKVLDVAMEKFGTILPLGFDTIIKGDKADPEQVVKDWLRKDFENLKEKMDKVRGKQEYGVQIFYDPRVIGEAIARESQEIQKLKEEMATQKPGMAYMYKQKVEKAVKEEMEKRAEQYFKDFYQAIKNHVDDIKVDKVKRDRDKTMLMSLSCLVLKEKVEDLGNELERVNNMEGFFVRFTGPWAPYSFV